MEIPVGYWFDPTEEEILGYFLKNKVAAGDWVCRGVSDCPNFFGNNSLEPWVLCGGCREEEEEEEERQSRRHYFFAIRKKRGARFVRKVGSGTWSGNQTYPCAFGGSRREFAYEGGSVASENNAWLMTEYDLSPNHNWVFCIVRRKHKKTTTRKRKISQINIEDRNPKKTTTKENHQLVPAPTPSTSIISTIHDDDHHHQGSSHFSDQFLVPSLHDQVPNDDELNGSTFSQEDWLSTELCQSQSLSLEQGHPSNVVEDQDCYVPEVPVESLSVEQDRVLSNAAQGELQLWQCSQDFFGHVPDQIIQLDDDEPLAVNQTLPPQPNIPNDEPLAVKTNDPANNINLLSNDHDQSECGNDYSQIVWENDNYFLGYEFQHQSCSAWENDKFGYDPFLNQSCCTV